MGTSIFFLIPIGCVGLLLLFLLIISPGKLAPLKDKNSNKINGAINEKVILSINSTQQGLFIRGEKKDKPVILFLHGGPGNPELFMIEKAETSERLEKDYIVCYWDQRGSGMSNSGKLDLETLTLEQLVEDTLAVTEYLKERFHQQKIYLMGHSWGSLLGIKVIEKYPDNYHAYLGISQVTNQTESEKRAYHFMKLTAEERNDEEALSALNQVDINSPDFPSDEYLGKVRTKYLNQYGGGIFHEGFSAAGFTKALMFFRGYTLKEKINCLKGMMTSGKVLMDALMKTDLMNSSLEFKIPIYIAQGKYDYQVSQVLAEEYFNLIVAPKKTFKTFELSAHSPNLEEYDAFVSYVKETFVEG